MATRRWIVFADDTGDPGANGSPLFGYAVFVVDRASMADLVEARTLFRHRVEMYREPKGGNVNHERFRQALESLAHLFEEDRVTAAACLIAKDRYRGHWLHARDGMPADPHFLRNYLIRKTLELGFDGAPYGVDDSIELVLDRVDYSDEQVLNLRRYLRSDFAEHGAFGFPRVSHVTHGDSLYVDGLQIADHLARLAYAVARGTARDEASALARRLSVWLRWCRGARSRWLTAPGVRWDTEPAPGGDKKRRRTEAVYRPPPSAEYATVQMAADISKQTAAASSTPPRYATTSSRGGEAGAGAEAKA